MKLARTIVALAAALGMLLGTATASAVDFTASEKEKLATGKPLRKPLAKSGQNGFYAGSGFAVVDAPVDVVWRAIQDWSSYAKVYPKTVGVKEIARKDGHSLVRMELGHEMISVVYHCDIQRDEKKHIMRFELVENKPHDIESARGYWRLFPQKDGSTLVAYVVAVKVPMGLVNQIGRAHV